MSSVRLERGDQHEVELLCGVKVRLQGYWLPHFREPVPAALLRRLYRDTLPFLTPVSRLVRGKADNRALADQRDDSDGTQFRRLLDDYIHVLPFRDGLAENDVGGGLRRPGMMQD